MNELSSCLTSISSAVKHKASEDPVFDERALSMYKVDPADQHVAMLLPAATLLQMGVSRG